mgnify:CR=1 FL=1
MAKVSLNVNGKPRTLDVDPTTPLLYVLRNDLELNGPRFGCGLAQCGACTVIVDGKAVRSCVTPVRTVEKKAITTLEGLGSSKNPHPLQQAFIDEQAVQCGYCMNGILMNAKVLLDKTPNPTLDQIKEHMDPILCRCGTHPRIVKAIQRAATTMKPAKAKA